MNTFDESNGTISGHVQQPEVSEIAVGTC